MGFPMMRHTVSVEQARDWGIDVSGPVLIDGIDVTNDALLEVLPKLSHFLNMGRKLDARRVSVDSGQEELTKKLQTGYSKAREALEKVLLKHNVRVRLWQR